MTPEHIVRLPLRNEDGPIPRWPFGAMADIDAEHHREILGHADLCLPAATLHRRYSYRSTADKVLFLALAPTVDPDAAKDAHTTSSGNVVGMVGEDGNADDVVGYLYVNFPLKDNTSAAHFELVVRIGQRGRGYGTALIEAFHEFCQRMGRTRSNTWTLGRGNDGPDQLRPAEGEGSVVMDGAARFALAHGYELGQVENYSQLDLMTMGDTSVVQAEARGRAGDYETITWQGVTPPEYRDAMAELYRRMSIDIPLAALEWDEEEWDADRVAESNQQTVDDGSDLLTSVARHRQSGELAAFTTLELPRDMTHTAYQEDTLVHGDHRGKRLGLLVKLANIDALREHFPAVRRIHTWNAAENEHMLAINTSMGFTLAGMEGAWQRRV